MKKLMLTAAAAVFTLASYAQSTVMNVHNKTACPVEISNPTAFPSCSIGGGGFTPMAPFSITTFTSGTSDMYYNLRVYAATASGSCGPTYAVTVGAPCTTLPATDVLDIFFNPACALCQPNVNVWYDITNAPTSVDVYIY